MHRVNEILNDISTQNIVKHIKKLEGIRHPITGPEALENAEAYIWDTLASYDHEMAAHLFEEDGKQYRNVIAVQKGTQHPGKIIIVLAHFDTVPDSPGADDKCARLPSFRGGYGWSVGCRDESANVSRALRPR